MRARSPNHKNISECIQWGSEQCQKTSASPRLDAEILLMHLLDKPSSYSRTWPDKSLTEQQLSDYEKLIKQRLKPTPIAYIIGHKEFWSRQFNVDSSTLIPRPETELLVEKALDFMLQDNRINTVLDLGTGSGCIAITLKKECPQCRVSAAELSANALKVAQQNAQLHEANITFFQSSWFDDIPNQVFHLIVSNPPYIPRHDKHLSQGDLPAEPITALTAGITGLDDIKLITQQSAAYLTVGGQLIIEHGYDQQKAVLELFELAHFINIQQFNDLSGQARLTVGEKP